MELKDILKYQGIELGEDATVEDYKKAFDETFVRLDQAADHPDVKKANVGEATRKYATELKRTAKEHGVELSKEDTDLPVDELARLVAAKIQESNTTIIEELKAKSGKPSEALEKLTSDYEKLKLKLADEERVKTEIAEKLTLKEKEFTTFEKNYKLNDAKKNLMKEAESFLSVTADPLRKKGFFSTINEKYKMDLDENGEFLITNEKGERIADPSKHGAWLPPIEVLKQDAKELGVLKEVDTSKVNQPPTPTPQPMNLDGVRVPTQRQVMPRT